MGVAGPIRHQKPTFSRRQGKFGAPRTGLHGVRFQTLANRPIISCPAPVASGLFGTATFQTLKAFHTQSPGLPAPSGLPWVTFPHGRANPERVPPGREKGGGHLLCHPVWHALSA